MDTKSEGGSQNDGGGVGVRQSEIKETKGLEYGL